MARAKARKSWSYKAGERGRNRVRAFEDEKRGVIFLEFAEQDGSGRSKKKRVSAGHIDRERGKAQAEELAGKLRRPAPQSGAALTMVSLFDNYLREVTPEKSLGKQRHDRATAQLILRCFGAERHPKTLNRRDWDKFIKERRRGSLRPPGPMRTKREREAATRNRPVGEQQVRYDLQFLLACLNWATKVHDPTGEPLLNHNPLRGFQLPKEESPRRPMLSQTQIDSMLSVAPLVSECFALALLFAGETGHRIGSIRQLRWHDVDLVQRTVRWRADNDKIGLDHTTPLSDELTAALKVAAKSEDGWVFPSSKNEDEPCSRYTFLKWWKQAEKLAGITHVKGLGFHSLRRRFANDLKTTNLRDLCGLGGWKSPQTVLTVYQQPELAVMRQALDARSKQRTDSRNGQQMFATSEIENPARAVS